MAVNFRWLAASLALLLLAPSALAQTNARTEVANAIFAASATHAAELRAADQRLRDERVRIEAVAARARAGETAARNELASLQERYVTELAKRDLAYAQEIAVFRDAVEDIAATQEGAAALARYNSGDQVGALSILDDLQRARARARAAVQDVQNAGELRQIAQLALQAIGSDGVTTQSVLGRFEAITELDPTVSSDWVQLSELYSKCARTSDSIRAAQRAVDTAGNDLERAQALRQLTTRQHAAWDADGAAASLNALVALRRKLLEASPENQSHQLHYAEALLLLVDQAGERGPAIIPIVEPLCRSVTEPRLQEWAAFVCAGVARARVHIFYDNQRLGESGPAAEALLAHVDAALARFPYSARLRALRPIALRSLGNARSRTGDVAGTLATRVEATALERALVAADPTNLEQRRIFFGNLLQQARSTQAAGDATRARQELDEAMRVLRETPTERGNISGLELTARAIRTAADFEMAAGNDTTAAQLHVEALSMNAELIARFPEAPRTFTTMSGNLDRILSRGMAYPRRVLWLSVLDQVEANIEHMAPPPGDQLDRRLPLAITHGWRCYVHANNNDFERAESDCNSAVSIAEALVSEGPTFNRNRALARARGQLALLRGMQSRDAEAREAFQLAVDAYPQGDWLFRDRAIFHASRREGPEAIADNDLYIRLTPDPAEGLSRSCRYRAIFNIGVESAAEACNRAIAMWPENINARANRGLLHLRNQNYAAAIVDFDHVLSSNARDSEALYGRGYARLRSGQVSQGRADIAAAITVNRNVEASFVGWGFTLP